MEQAAQGSVHGPKCCSLRSIWTALSDRGFDFGWNQGLDLMILVDPFKVRILYDFKSDFKSDSFCGILHKVFYVSEFSFLY